MAIRIGPCRLAGALWFLQEAFPEVQIQPDFGDLKRDLIEHAERVGADGLFDEERSILLKAKLDHLIEWSRARSPEAAMKPMIPFACCSMSGPETLR